MKKEGILMVRNVNGKWEDISFSDYLVKREKSIGATARKLLNENKHLFSL
jgi:hypothetical protein